VDISDSYHIYGSYFTEFEGFLNLVEKRSFADRVWSTEFAEPFFEEARGKLAREKQG
jgi:thymidylate synthase